MIKSDKQLCADVWLVLKRQLLSFWTIDEVDEREMLDYILIAINQVRESYDASARIYYRKYGFSVLNTTVYAVFLYYLAHIIGYGGGVDCADKIYYLNKIMNGVEWYWNIDLPKHFICEHPVGTVLGRASYGDYFCVYQGVTVGANFIGEECIWPSLGNYVTMYANSTVIGASCIGNNVIIAANAFVLNEIVPDNCVVYGSSPDLKIKQCSKTEIEEKLVRIWNFEH